MAANPALRVVAPPRRVLKRPAAVQQCGWLKDKYGVSWQIIPTALGEMLDDPDPDKSQRVMKAMMPPRVNLIRLGSG